MSETKLIRVYIDDEPKLIELRRDLTRKTGEQASFADVVSWLLNAAEGSSDARQADSP